MPSITRLTHPEHPLTTRTTHATTPDDSHWNTTAPPTHH